MKQFLVEVLSGEERNVCQRCVSCATGNNQLDYFSHAVLIGLKINQTNFQSDLN